MQSYFLFLLKTKNALELFSCFEKEGRSRGGKFVLRKKKDEEEVTWIKGVSSIKTKLLIDKKISTMNRGSIRCRLL